MNKRFYILLVSLLFIPACKVTQNYRSQSGAAGADLYRDNPAADTATIANLPWKELFTDTHLQALITEGINQNLDLKIAVARIKQAEANFAQSKAAFLPDLNANVNANFQNLQKNQTGTTQYYQAYLSSSWEADIWGKLRAAKRAQLASLLQSEAYRQAVQVQLVANIATNYFSLLAFDAQLQLTYKTVENRKSDVETVKLLKESDVVTGAAVVQSEANRYSAEVMIPDLKQNIRETENTISLLLGRSPGEIVRDSLTNESIASDLKTGFPAQLLSNRPDVEEAEFQVRNSFELVNVARTYFYPSISITAQGGISGATISQLFSPGTVFGNIVAGLVQPIFNRGLNKQRLQVARAAQEEDLAAFKRTLLTAGQEVSNALYQYQAALDKTSLRSQEITFLQKAVDYTRELMKYTANTNYTDVLTSEQSLLAAELNSIDDRLQQLQALVALYRSLGGGRF